MQNKFMGRIQVQYESEDYKTILQEKKLHFFNNWLFYLLKEDATDFPMHIPISKA